MAFQPSPLTANANVQLDIESKVEDSCKCFCCPLIKGMVKSLAQRKKTLSSTQIKTEIIKTEILEDIEV